MALEPRIDGNRMSSVRKALYDRLERERLGDAEYEKRVVSPVDRTFIVVLVAIGIIFAGTILAITFMGL